MIYTDYFMKGIEMHNKGWSSLNPDSNVRSSDVFLIVAIILIFLSAVGGLFYIWLNTPVMEVSHSKGNCVKVFDAKGNAIPNGCKKVKSGQMTTDHYFAR